MPRLSAVNTARACARFLLPPGDYSDALNNLPPLGLRLLPAWPHLVPLPAVACLPTQVTRTARLSTFVFWYVPFMTSVLNYTRSVRWAPVVYRHHRRLPFSRDANATFCRIFDAGRLLRHRPPPALHTCLHHAWLFQQPPWTRRAAHTHTFCHHHIASLPPYALFANVPFRITADLRDGPRTCSTMQRSAAIARKPPA